MRTPEPGRRRISHGAWRRARPGTGGEAGMAMLVTVLVLVVVMSLLTVVFEQGVQSLPLARHAQDFQSALQAAEAGVEDYINRLDNNSSYYLYTTDAANPAFSGWTPVPGTNVDEWFRYAVDNTSTGRTGVVHLIVSGAAGQDPATGSNPSVRTIDVGIQLSGFTSFLYYTDYEIVDPAIATVDGANYSKECVFRAWQWNTYTNRGYGPDPSCAPDFIYFANSDVLNGPVFSNDEIHTCGSPTFRQGVTTAYNQSTALDVHDSTSYGGPGPGRSAVYQDPSCGGSPRFDGPGAQPAGGGFSPFPATNTNMQSDLSAGNDGGGCSYTGPISVVFNAAGTMNVNVPSGSTATAPVAGIRCSGSGIPLPPNGLLYDANKSCSWSSCYANVSVSGVVHGQVTVGSQNNITVTGQLTDANPNGSDVIGLSATNSIILDPVSGGLTIDAAMVALDHSIYLPNWSSYGSLGKLTVDGSLAQEFRGPIGTTAGSGYQKNYTWDSRLRYLQPPYFTSPTLPNWVKSSFAECRPTPTPTATTC